MAAPTSTAAYKVPDWAVKNKELFLSQASRRRGADVATPAKTDISPLYMSLADPQAIPADAQVSQAAMSMAVLAEEVQNGIRPPTGPPGANYFRDVANHPDVLSTIISTARHTVGFLPGTNGAQLTEEQLFAYIVKFNRFLVELLLYYPYIQFTGANSHTVQTNTIDCDFILRTITGVLAEALGVPTSGAVFDALVTTTSAVIREAVDYVTRNGKATSANFEMLGLPKSNEVGKDPCRDPVCAVTFTVAMLSQQQSGKSSITQSTFLNISANSCKLNSSAVIEDADYLAGTTITGVKNLRHFVNSVLDYK